MESQTHAQGRGRPSKYSDDLPDLLLDYFNEYLQNPSRQEITERTVKYYQDGKVKEKFEKFKNVSREPPTLFGFGLKHKINYRTLLRWSKERIGTAPDKGEPDNRPLRYPDFCRAYKLTKDFQTEFFLKVGMAGSAPPVFTMFSMKNMVGWRDATEQRIVDEHGKDRAMPSYVILPARKTEQEVAADEAAENHGGDAVDESGPVLP